MWVFYVGGFVLYLLLSVAAFLYLSIPLILIAFGAGALAGAGLALRACVAVWLGSHPVPVLAPGSAGDAAVGRVVRAPADPAWLPYLAGQGFVDLASATERCMGEVGRLWAWIARRLRENSYDRALDLEPWKLAALAWPAVPPVAGALVGVSVGAAVMLAAVGAALLAIAAPIGVLAVGAGLVIRGQDGLVRGWRGATASCPRCFHVTKLPTYRCPHALEHHASDARHTDIRPGWRGVVWRRCACGHQLPTGVLRASRHLIALCPNCGHRLHTAAGTQRDVRVGVFGAASAGKTCFLRTGYRQLVDGPHRGALVEPIDDAAREADEAFRQLLESDGLPRKTPTNQPPEVFSAVLRWRGHGSTLHLFDVAGEVLADTEQHGELAYFDHTETLVFVLDPFSIPQVREAVERQDAGLLSRAAAAGVDPEESYNDTVQRLRHYGVRTVRQRLAFVVSKFDLLRDLPLAAGVCDAAGDPADSAAVRIWLRAQGMDNLILAVDRDFGEVRFFLCSMWLPAPADPATPLRWLLATEGLL